MHVFSWQSCWLIRDWELANLLFYPANVSFFFWIFYFPFDNWLHCEDCPILLQPHEKLLKNNTAFELTLSPMLRKAVLSWCKLFKCVRKLAWRKDQTEEDVIQAAAQSSIPRLSQSSTEILHSCVIAILLHHWKPLRHKTHVSPPSCDLPSPSNLPTNIKYLFLCPIAAVKCMLYVSQSVINLEFHHRLCSETLCDEAIKLDSAVMKLNGLFTIDYSPLQTLSHQVRLSPHMGVCIQACQLLWPISPI